MAETAFSIPDLLRRSFTDARGAARQVMDLGLSVPVLVQALILVVVLDVLLLHIALDLDGGPPPPTDLSDPRNATAYNMVRTFLENPLFSAFIQASFLTLTVFGIHVIGRAMDGIGQFEDSLSVIVLFQALLIVMQVLQAIATLVFPPLTVLVSFATVILFFYWLTQFVMEVHGFQSALSVLTMIVVSGIGVLIALSLVLAILGVAVIGDVSNV